MRWLGLVVLLAVAVSVGAGCSSEAPAGGVEFGSGDVPGLLPSEFPVPAEARVGTTMTDHDQGLVEMLITLPADVNAVRTYFEDNLPGRGFEITRTEGTSGDWVIEFTGGGGTGRIQIEAGGAGLAAAVIQFTTVEG